MNIGEENEEKGMTNEEKREFLKAVSEYKRFGESIYRSGNLAEVYESIKGIVETAHKVTLEETGDWFDKVTVNRHMKSMNESFKVFSNTIKEVNTLQQRLESCYDEMGEVLGKYYEIKEGNEFGAARAKAIANGDSEFEVDGKKFPVKDVDKDDKENAEKFAKESVNEGYVKSMGFKAVSERIDGLTKSLDPNSILCRNISKQADNVKPEFKQMKKRIDEIEQIWGEVEYTIEMSNESVNEVKDGATAIWVGKTTKIDPDGKSVIIKKGDKGEVIRQDHRDQYLVRFGGRMFYAHLNKNFKVDESVNEESVNEGYGDWVKAKNLTDIVKLSKEKKNATFYVTDDNNSRIGSFYLKNGKFAKATTANASYDLQNNKTSLRDRSDVIYKYKIDESVNEAGIFGKVFGKKGNSSSDGETFTATNKETGNVSTFKSKANRDAAVKAGTHEAPGSADGDTKSAEPKEYKPINWDRYTQGSYVPQKLQSDFDNGDLSPEDFMKVIAHSTEGKGRLMFNRKESQELERISSPEYIEKDRINNNWFLKDTAKETGTTPEEVKARFEKLRDLLAANNESVNEEKSMKLKDLLSESFGFGNLPSDKLIKMKKTLKEIEEDELVNESKYTVINPKNGNVMGAGLKDQAAKLSKKMGGEKKGYYVIPMSNAKKARRALEKFNFDLKNPKLHSMLGDLYFEGVDESMNEGASTEEKRIVMMAIKKIAKYRNVPLDYAVGDVMRAAQELERDIQKGKVKK